METEDIADRMTVENLHSGEEEDFLRRLQSFPNLFFQDCAKRATETRLKSILRTIESKQQRVEETNLADLLGEGNPKNIITFLKWTLGHVPEAEAMAAREVQERPSNVLALSNSAYVLWQKGETGQAWGRLEELEALRDGDQQLYDDLETEGRLL